MKAYKKCMGVVLMIENVVLALSMLLVLVLTFGNVIARKIFQHSWGFTEEIVVAVFVLLSLLGAGVAARQDGGLVNLGLVPDMAKPRGKRGLNLASTVICLIYSVILTIEGIGRIIADETMTPILHIHKAWFWGFVVVGGISLCLHFIENCIDYQTKTDAELVLETEEKEGQAS
ncbi:MAG: TRAP transporter small permease subunit [Lachnospiraceae bacterium]|nr:TRAP transporter small permease subunit [Lachnospiraceae bacterium]